MLRQIFNKMEEPNFFLTKWRNLVKLDRSRKVWYLLLHVFWLRLPKFTFWKENWALEYVSTQNLDFPNVSFFPMFLCLKLFRNLWGKSDTKLAILDIICLFTYGQSGVYQNIAMFQNIMTIIVWKFSFCPLHFQRWF